MFTTEKVTKDEILTKIPQENIFEYYLKISVQLASPFKNPLRKDKHADCRFYIDSRNMLKFHDIPKGWNWDCFNLVCIIHKCNFYESLDIIAQDFNLRELTPDIELIRKRRISNLNLPIKKKKIKIVVREWHTKDLKYWNQLDITKSILNFFKVFPFEKAYLDDILIYNYYNSKDLGYCYYLEHEDMKLYFPFRRKGESQYPKFYHNCPTSVQGYYQLPPTGEFLIITKSMKDVMALFTYKIDAIANISETIIIREKVMENLKKRFKVIYTLFDRDKTGISMSIKMRNEYDTIPLFMPSDKLFAIKDEKDFSDNRIKYGRKHMLNLINKFQKWHQSNLTLSTTEKDFQS